MRWRLLGVTGLLLLVGLAGGWAVASARSDDPQVMGPAQPVTAQAPAVPTAAATTSAATSATPSEAACFADPTDPALGIDLPSSTHRLSTGKRGYAIALDLPDGWRINRTGQTNWSMTDTVALNTYVMRVDITADSHASVTAARDSRLVELDQAEKDGNLPGFEVDSTSPDSFAAHYVQNGYCRLTYERFLSLGQSSAYVDLAVTGREEDRAGVMDLIARTAATMQIS